MNKTITAEQDKQLTEVFERVLSVQSVLRFMSDSLSNAMQSPGVDHSLIDDIYYTAKAVQNEAAEAAKVLESVVF